VSVTEVGVVNTRYGVSQPVASRRLNAGWLKAKFYYASWFEAGRRPASNLSATIFEPASVMEFGF